MLNSCWRRSRPLYNFQAALLLKVFAPLENMITSRKTFRLTLRANLLRLCYRINRNILSRGLQLQLDSKQKGGIFCLLCFWNALLWLCKKKKYTDEKSLEKELNFFSYKTLFWPPTYFCGVEEMCQVLLEHCVYLEPIYKLRYCYNMIICLEF